MGLNPSALGVGFQPEPTQERRNPSSANALGSDILDSNSHELRLEKSNILLLGPTGSGNVFTLLGFAENSNDPTFAENSNDPRFAKNSNDPKFRV